MSGRDHAIQEICAAVAAEQPQRRLHSPWTFTATVKTLRQSSYAMPAPVRWSRRTGGARGIDGGASATESGSARLRSLPRPDIRIGVSSSSGDAYLRSASPPRSPVNGTSACTVLGDSAAVPAFCTFSIPTREMVSAQERCALQILALKIPRPKLTIVGRRSSTKRTVWAR